MSLSQPIVITPRLGRNDAESVQRTLRALIWLGIFVVLMLLTLLLAGILYATGAGVLGLIVLVLGFVGSLIIPGLIARHFYVLPEYKRLVVLRMGRFAGIRGPGKAWVLPYPPFYQSVAAEIDTRVQTRVITASETLTRDNVPVGTEAVIFWRVEDPKRAALSVGNYAEAVFQAANSALKDTIGTLELSELLSNREKVAQQLKQIIDQAAARFGVDVSSVEITDVHVPTDLIQELSVLAQAQRSAQAKLAEAEVERQVAEKLQRAAEQMGPQAMEMYRLNVLERIGREEGSQIVVYGLSSGAPFLEQGIAAAAAGTRTR